MKQGYMIANPQNGWEIALNRHLQSLSSEYRQVLSESASVDDLICILKRSQKTAEEKRSNKLLDVLQKCAAPLHEFQSVIDVLVQGKPEVGCVVWAPLKMILLMLEKRQRGFDQIAEKILLLTLALPRYKLYCDHFRQSQILQKALGNLFASYIEFCVQAVKYFEDDGIVNFIKSVSGSFNKRFDKIFQSMGRYRKEIERTVAALSLSIIQDVKAATTETEREKTLRWLSPSNFEAEITDYSRNWIQGTCEWILQNPQFTEWITTIGENVAPRILWIYGNLGCGKTYLNHFLYDYLSAQKQVPVILYLFNAKQENNSKRSGLSFIRTVVYQLLTSKQVDARIGFEFLRESRSASGHGEAQSPVQLWTTARKVLQSSATEVYLFVDALDECHSHDRQHLLDEIFKLCRDVHHLKVLVTSRPEEDISDWFGEENHSLSISTIKWPVPLADKDIQIYLARRLEGSCKLNNPKVMKDIENMVLGRAEGMFLYARLLLDDLEKEATISALRKRVREFPKSLNAYYTEIFRQIDASAESNRTLASNVLLWTIGALEPMHVNTLLIALKSQSLAFSKQRQPDQEAGEDEELLDPINQIRFVCFPLLDISEGGIVQVVHCSVTEFILAQGHALSFPNLVPTMSQTNHRIASSCLCFLSKELVRHEDISLADVERPCSIISDTCHAVDGALHFRRYSVLYWEKHMAASMKYFDEQLNAILEILKPGSNAYQKLVRDRSVLDFHFKTYFGSEASDSPPHPIFIAVYFSIGPLVQVLLDQNASCDLVTNYGNSLVHVAVDTGCEEILSQLHRAGVSLDATNTAGQTALHLAARNGHESITSFLLQCHCDFRTLDSAGRSALLEACSCGAEGTVNILLEAGASASVVSNAGYSALAEAAAGGHLSVVMMLISSGIAISMDRALSLASAHGHLEVVEFLLSRNANVRERDRNLWTPLHWAARNRHENIVNTLIQNGADVDAEDDFGRTPLNRAVRSGNTNIASTLLRAGASPSIQDKSGDTLIHIAAADGCLDIVKLLLGAGVDVNAHDQAMRTALHRAAGNGHGTLVELLLSEGADVDSQDAIGFSALHWAAATGKVQILDILLSAKASALFEGSVDRKGRIPLAVAVECRQKAAAARLVRALAPDGKVSGRARNLVNAALRVATDSNFEEIISVLAPYAVNVNSMDDDVGLAMGRTALNSAAASGDIDTFQRLLDAGVTEGGDKSALGYAAEAGQLEMVSFLLKDHSHASEMCFQQPNSALILAINNGRSEIVENFRQWVILKESEGNSPGSWVKWSDVLADIKIGEILLELTNNNAGRIILVHDILSTCALHEAIGKGNVRDVQQQLKGGANPNCFDSQYGSPLNKAIRVGNTEVVRNLLEAGASPRLGGLYAACNCRDKETVELLLEAGADPNQGDRHGGTPLQGALESATDLGSPFRPIGDTAVEDMANPGVKRATSVEIVDRLLGSGAGVNFRNPSDMSSPLHTAAESSDVSMVRRLLNAGALVDQTSAISLTPLHCAIRREIKNSRSLDQPKSDCSFEIFETLLEAGASLNGMGDRLISALHIAALGENELVTRRLIELGADVNACDSDGRTPLIWAAMGRLGHRSPLSELCIYSFGHCPSLTCVNLLLAAGANVHLFDSCSKNALHWAAFSPHPDVVQVLLEHGADVNATDSDQRTPLHLAILSGSVDCVELLLKAGADPNVVDNKQSHIRDLLNDVEAYAENVDSTRMYMSQLTPLAVAVSNNGIVSEWGKMIRLLLDAGADPRFLNHNCETLFHIVVRERNMERLGSLLSLESRIVKGKRGKVSEIPDREGKTPYQRALETGDERLINVFREPPAVRRDGFP